MTEDLNRTLAHQICRALFPAGDVQGIEHAIREELLLEALAQRPAPKSVCELRAAIERIGLRRGSAGIDIVAALDGTCRREPSKPIGELAGCGTGD